MPFPSYQTFPCAISTSLLTCTAYRAPESTGTACPTCPVPGSKRPHRSRDRGGNEAGRESIFALAASPSIPASISTTVFNIWASSPAVGLARLFRWSLHTFLNYNLPAIFIVDNRRDIRVIGVRCCLAVQGGRLESLVICCLYLDSTRNIFYLISYHLQQLHMSRTVMHSRHNSMQQKPF